MFAKKSVLWLLIMAVAVTLAACSVPSSRARAAEPSVSTSAGGTNQLSAAATATVYLPVVATESSDNSAVLPYTVIDTGQNGCYNNVAGITCPQDGNSFYGQDAQYAGVQASYQDNNDGTITDLNTGLMWQKTPNLDQKSTYAEAVAGADTFNLAGYDDWRLPTIKELYSLIDFNGSIISSTPYLDTATFDFVYGDESAGERQIDAQYWSSTEYVGTVFGGSEAVFGVNFADGRIKGYPKQRGNGQEMQQFVRYVRGNTSYGINNFVNNGNGTISDAATGLMWQQQDSGTTLNWESALAYCEGLEAAGYNDWRLPDAKELQSIVDYTRAPDAANAAQQGPAIDPIFSVSETEAWYWSSTTHLDRPDASAAVYVSFGQAFGVYNGSLLNVHGAGAQRSDPKSGNPADWSAGLGPQNDEIRIYNYARCVRGGGVDLSHTTGADAANQFTAAAAPAGPPQSPGGQSGGQPGGSPPNRRTPPPEALAACNAATQGDACTFNAPHGTISGTCRSVQSQQLACVPTGGPPGGRQQ